MNVNHMDQESLRAEILQLRNQLEEIAATQPKNPEAPTTIRKLHKIKTAPKDKWDIAQILLGTLLLPSVIAIVGWAMSNAVTKSEQATSRTIAEAQLKAANAIAQSNLIKDYVSILAQAAVNQNDKELLTILDSLAALKKTDGMIPLPIQGILSRINKESKNPKILQAASSLVSNEVDRKLDSYFLNGQ